MDSSCSSKGGASESGENSSSLSISNRLANSHSIRMWGYISQAKDNTSASSSSVPSARGAEEDSSEQLSSLFFHSVHSTSQATPPSRWAHSAACVSGDKSSSMIIFGGIGHTQYDDCWELNCDTLGWRQILASGDKPEKILGHASAALGSRFFLIGGQVGRTFVKKLYILDTRQWVWTRPSISESNLPSARSGHALVASNGDLWLFGGQGKKLMSDFYRLDVSRNEVTFHEISPAGEVRPSPRKGHSLTYDPSLNSLVLFGGTTASGADNSLWVYNIGSNQWSQPKCTGPIPSARSNHTAVAVSKYHILFWGGCSTDGVFFSDSYVLDTRQWHFHHPQLLNQPPAQRYHHTCVVPLGMEGKCILYGGINQKQTFGSVVTFEFRLMSELAPALDLIAAELQSLTRTSINSSSSRGGASASQAIVLTGEGTSRRLVQHLPNPRTNLQREFSSQRESYSGTQNAAGAPGPGNTLKSRETSSASALPDHILRTQLTGLLVKRDLQEMHSQASRRLEDLDAEVEGLKRELALTKVLKDEAEGEALAAKELARKQESKAEKEAAMAAVLRGKLQEAEVIMRESEREKELMERRILELTKELGIATSRLSKLQNEGRGGFREKAVVNSQGLPSSSSVSENAIGGREESATIAALLSASEQRAESLASQVESLEVEKAALMERVLRLEGDESQIRSLRLHELRELEARLRASLSSVQAAVLVEERIEREVQLRLAQRSSTHAASSSSALNDQNQCSICLERSKEIVFGCGHQSCLNCGGTLELCPFCRVAITARIKLFNA